jgi:hypothetical protein
MKNYQATIMSFEAEAVRNNINNRTTFPNYADGRNLRNIDFGYDLMRLIA